MALSPEPRKACTSIVEAALRQFCDSLIKNGLAEERVHFILDLTLASGFAVAVADRCLASLEASQFDIMRQDALGRVLVKPFASILDVEFPRKKLKALFEATHLMAGDAEMSEAVALCAGAADRLKELHGQNFSWDQLYGDLDAQIAADRIRFAVAKSFVGRFEKRLEWLLSLMSKESRYKSVDSHAYIHLGSDGSPSFHVCRSLMLRILALMCDDFSASALGPERRKALSERYGKDCINIVSAFRLELLKAASRH